MGKTLDWSMLFLLTILLLVMLMPDPRSMPMVYATPGGAQWTEETLRLATELGDSSVEMWDRTNLKRLTLSKKAATMAGGGSKETTVLTKASATHVSLSISCHQTLSSIFTKNARCCCHLCSHLVLLQCLKPFLPSMPILTVPHLECQSQEATSTGDVSSPTFKVSTFLVTTPLGESLSLGSITSLFTTTDAVYTHVHGVCMARAVG